MSVQDEIKKIVDDFKASTERVNSFEDDIAEKIKPLLKEPVKEVYVALGPVNEVEKIQRKEMLKKILQKVVDQIVSEVDQDKSKDSLSKMREQLFRQEEE